MLKKEIVFVPKIQIGKQTQKIHNNKHIKKNPIRSSSPSVLNNKVYVVR